MYIYCSFPPVTIRVQEQFLPFLIPDSFRSLLGRGLKYLLLPVLNAVAAQQS